VTFDDFLTAHLSRLSRFAAVLCGDRWLAEDVVQEVLARAQNRWPELSRLDQPDAYVRRMIVNEFLSWRRRLRRNLLVADVPDGPVRADPIGQHGDREALVAELAKPPRKQRTVIVLRYYGGLSDAEIAADLGCSTGTVRSHASRALAKLRVEMRPIPTLAQER
jgi:RNA polymerase sigma-70 factor (sigma-E family)